MAKKKKVVIVDEELTPTILYTKKEKKGSVIWLIIIFAIFIAVVINLPDIIVYLDEYINPQVVTPSNPDTEEDDDTSDEPVSDDVVKYELTENLQIDEENFSLTNFVIANNQISFSITNNGEELLDFSNMDYFLNLYNDSNMLLQRIMITDEMARVGETINLTYDLDNSEVSVISFLQIAEEDYPAHIVDADDDGNATLVCTKDYETVNYSLTNNLVNAIEDVFVVSATDENYNTLYSSYQALSTTYNAIDGVVSSVVVEENVLTFRTTINLNTMNNEAFSNIIYYPLNTDYI